MITAAPKKSRALLSKPIGRVAYTLPALFCSFVMTTSKASAQLVDVCSGIRANIPVLQPITGGFIDPLLNGLVGNINSNLLGALSGQTLNIGVVDTNGNLVSVGNCNIKTDDITVSANKGITLGGGKVDGLGGPTNSAANAGEINSISIGNGNATSATALSAVSIGLRGSVTATDGVGIGRDSVVSGAGGVAMGQGSVVSGAGGVALGQGAVTSSTNGVALGAGSVASRAGMNGATEAFSGVRVASTAGAVSVGSLGNERQITNVAGGTADTDAVNVRQLRAVEQSLYVPLATNNVSNFARPTAAGVDAMAVGYGASAGGDQSSAVGTNSSASGVQATATGYGASASGAQATATGYGASAVGDGSSSYGATASANGTQATATGYGASASGDRSSSYGATASANGARAAAVGYGASANGDRASSFGSGASASGVQATVAGSGASAGGVQSTAVGSGTSASGAQATAVGYGSSAGYANSTAVGAGAQTSRANQVAVGTAASTYTMAGVASTASQNAQRGITRLLTTDSAGNIATSNVDINGLDRRVSTLEADNLQNRRGIAAAMAMNTASMPSAPGRTSWAMNASTFQSEFGTGFAFAHRFNTAMPLAITGSYGNGGGSAHGGRIGLAGEF